MILIRYHLNWIEIWLSEANKDESFVNRRKRE